MQHQVTQVLLVDDDRVFRRLLKELLEESKAGFVIHDLGSANEAIRFLRADPPFTGRPRPDLILLDFELDNHNDALALIKLLRANHELKAVPVMIMSQGDHARESISAGADRFLLKPSEPKELQEAVMSFWRRSVQRMPVVLLVEDVEREAKFMREYLEDDFEVRWVKSPDQAMVEIRSGAVDCVVMDYQFDGVIQGPTYVRNIRKSHPTLPIVVVTGYGDAEMTRNAFRDLRADDFVAKEGDDWPHKVAQRVKTAYLAAIQDFFVRDGSIWQIRFSGKEVRVPGTIGFFHLTQLLRHPYRPFTTQRLLALVPCDQADLGGTSGDQDTTLQTEPVESDRVIDARAASEIKKRLKELQEQREDAERKGDWDEYNRIDDEEKEIARQFNATRRPGGQTKVLDPERENRRLNVRRNIHTAITRIAKEHPVLGDHLTESIKFGHQIEYHPKPSDHISWQIQV